MPVSPGDPLRITAADWNTVLSAAAAYRGTQLGITTTPGGGDTPLLCHNTTATNLTRGQVLGLNEPLILPGANVTEFYYRPSLSGILPAVPTHTGKWCLAIEDIPANKLGRVAMSGLYAVPLTLNYATHPYATIANGSHDLVSNWYGAAEVVWASGSYALVRLGPFQAPPYRATVTESGGIAGGASGEVTIYYGGAITNPAQTATAWHNWMAGATAAAEDAECIVRYFADEDKWRILELEC